MADAELVQAFNDLPLKETTPSGFPNHWHFSVRRVPLRPPQDLLHIVHPDANFIHSAGPENILCLPTPAAKANVIVPHLLKAFVTGIDKGPDGMPVPDQPVFAPSRWCTNDADLARAVEEKLKSLGVREELCTVDSATEKENQVSNDSWLRLLDSLAQRAGVCEGCSKPASDFPAPLLRCGACRSAWYCSRECQKGDWKEHKKTCGQKPKTEAFHYFNRVAYTQPDAQALAKSMNLTLPDGKGEHAGIIQPIRRLVITGKDTPENFPLLLGPDWKDEKKTLEEQRLLALLAPPRGSPFFAVTASHDRGAPATTLRPAEPAEDRKLKTVRELQAKISQHLGCRKNPSGADMQAVLSSYGAGWGEMVPLYQIAINATDQGVRVP